MWRIYASAEESAVVEADGGKSDVETDLDAVRNSEDAAGNRAASWYLRVDL